MSDPLIHSLQGLSELSVTEKRDLIRNFLQLREGDAAGTLPLSFGQESLWFVYQLAPQSTAYNFLYAACIPTALNIDAFRKAAQQLVQRHPALRCSIHLQDRRPIQRINSDMTIEVPLKDATDRTREQLIEDMRSVADTPFDLENGPGLRMMLYRVEDGNHVLLLALHHIVADLWSMDILLEELKQLYQTVCDKKSPNLPPLPAQFSDYVRWQMTRVYGARGQKAWHFWKNELAGDIPVLDLPTDHPRPPVQTYNGAAYSWPLDDDTVRKLRSVSSRHGVTQFVAMLAAFETLLHRYSQQNEFLVGTVTADRDRPEWERMVGYFLNQVPIKAQIDGRSTFASLLEMTRDKVHAALEHRDYPFGMLVKRLQPKRDPSRSPLFQVMFIWDKPNTFPSSKTHTNGHAPKHALRLEPMIMEQRGSAFDLVFIVFEVGGQLTASLRYNTDLFDEDTIRRMAGHFDVLLQSMLAEPEARLTEISMLTPEEHKHIVYDWNNTETQYPGDVPFHHFIEQHAAQTPERMALILDDERWSYGRLNTNANKLARRLQAMGVGPQKPLALCMPRCMEGIAAMIAAWKIGAAYLPLDPAYPPQRLSDMIHDAQPAVLATLRDVPEFPERLPCPVLRLADEQETLAALPAGNVNVPVQPDDAAYIIYTSGSTGKPKGTLLRHRGMGNLLKAQQVTFDITKDDRVIQFASWSFDASVFDIVMGLGTGACLVLGRHADLLPGEGLINLMQRQQITVVTLPPSVLALLPDADLPALRLICVAGEACSSEVVAKWATGRRLLNLYGPTEATVWSTWTECQNDGQPPPIGKPIINVRTYVLDEYLQPVPAGVPGELHLSGPGLAAGYLNQPLTTAERFIPNPFTDTDEAVMYKTGDIVRYRANGNLEFLGRRDDQVKINGFRIELDEVKHVLCQHPSIADAVVLADKTGPSPTAQRMVAYIVPKNPNAVEPREVRHFLRQRLPAHMAPSAMRVLDQLPLTVNGKVDRKKLPAISQDAGGAQRKTVPPQTDRERKIAEIWQTVLHVDKIGRHDNFFELGGSSIQTLEAATAAQQHGLSLTAEMIFQYQTVTELAAVSERAQSNGSHTAPAPSLYNDTKPAHVPALKPATEHATGNMVIESLGVFLPPRVVTTAEVTANCLNKINFPLEKMTGIRSRRMAGETHFSIDLAAEAIRECFMRSSYKPADIDLLVCSNISRCDGPMFRFTFEPTTAARLQHQFGFYNALTFDTSNACAGTFTALSIVDAMLKQGAIRRAMVVSGEYITHLTETAQREIENFMDARMACLTLGDSGMAMILEKTDRTDVGFHDLEMYTLAKYRWLCVAKVTKGAQPGPIMHTDPVTSAAVTIKQAVRHAMQTLERKKWRPDDVDHLIMHQTSDTTLDGAIREINQVVGRQVCTRGNTVFNLAERANTATTTHFVAMWDQLEAGAVEPGDKIFFGVSGSGQTVGSALYTMDDLPKRHSRRNTPVEKNGHHIPELRRFHPKQLIRVESVGLMDGKTTEDDTVSMLLKAGEACLEQSRYQNTEIELVMHAGVYRSEFLMEPALATIAAGELGMNDDETKLADRRTFAFDLNNSGVGPLDACLVASQLLADGRFATAMVLATEVENNTEPCPDQLLGIQETGSAFVMEPSSNDEGFRAFGFRAFPQYLDAYNTFTSAVNMQPTLGIERDEHLNQHYVECISKTVREFLQLENVSLDAIDLVLPPMASVDFVTRLANALDMPRARYIMPEKTDLDWFTSSLAKAFATAKTTDVRGKLGLVISVGAGVQVGCALYQFAN